MKGNETIFKRTCSINFRANHSIFCHIGDLFFRWLPSFVTGTVCSVPRAFFLVGYLIYQYYSRRLFYKRLTSSLESLDQSLQKTEQTPISEALDQLLKNQYKHYQEQIKKLTSRQDEHLKFMNQWVHPEVSFTSACIWI